jgi:hypothetical protein
VAAAKAAVPGLHQLVAQAARLALSALRECSRPARYFSRLRGRPELLAALTQVLLAVR